MFLSEVKSPPLITREQLILLNRELAKDARAWTDVLVRHVGCADLGTRNRVYREVVAFAPRLAEFKFTEAGLKPEVAMTELPRRAHLSNGVQHPTVNGLLANLLTNGPTEAKTLGNFLAQYCLKSANAPDFTKAMFEEFCLATGLETKVLVGSGANLACLVFYFVAFGLLGFGPNATRSERNLVLKDARLCQEHFNQLMDNFIVGPGKFAALLPLLGLRQNEILMLAGLQRRRLLTRESAR